MVYHLALYFQQTCSWLNVIHYISVRSVLALLTALVLSFIFGGKFIEASRRYFVSPVRDFVPETHQSKGAMPSMGGVFIIGVTVVTILLWCNWCDPKIWIFLWGLIGFGIVGFWDDITKIRNKKGISERAKFSALLLVALSTLVLWYMIDAPMTTLCPPFFKSLQWDMGLWFIPWAIFILVGVSNAVNLTDGLDGLAIGSLVSNFATFAIIAYVTGHLFFAYYLQVPFAGTAELAIVCSILVGSSLGFLWYNAYPAQIFMGDVGSLALGGSLALIALMTRQEFLLAVSGGLFVVETLSVIIQVVSYKFFGRRVFRMAPIHHHFELLGWPESKITMRFGIISFVLCLLALLMLKLR